MPSASDKEEAAKVVGHISRLRRSEDLPLNEMAILYRTNAQSRSFEDALRERNIPYRIYGGYLSINVKRSKTSLLISV